MVIPAPVVPAYVHATPFSSALVPPVPFSTAPASPFRVATAPGLVEAEEPAVTLAMGTPLFVRGDARVRMRVGQEVRGHLVFDVYSDDALVLPKGTVVVGSVTELTPDKAHRLQSRLRADFTPFSTPVVRFTRAVLADGRVVELPLEAARDGAPLLTLTPPAKRKGGFFRKGITTVKTVVKDRIHVVTGPDKRDRLVDFLYTQLPYHPLFVPKGTAWTAETTRDVAMTGATAETTRQTAAAVQTGAADAAKTQAGWVLEASLKQELNSKTVKAGDAITAVVATPVFNEDGSVAVPEGSVLEGHVTKARAARRFGRGGDLRFDFRQLQLPHAEKQNVQTSILGVASAGDSGLALDSEGGTAPKPKDKLAVPLILFALAARPLHRQHHGLGRDAVASNSVGVLGFIVGTAGGWPSVAAGIGYYGTALAVWNRWIKKGTEVRFAKDTRLVLRTAVRRSEPLKPDRVAQ